MESAMSSQPIAGAGKLKSQAKSQKKKRSSQAKDGQTIPPELLMQRDASVRYERGGAVYATDGKLGSLRQVVVDESSCEVIDLVVAVDGANNLMLLSPDFVDKTSGSAIFLTVNRAQITERSGSTPDYVKSHFAAVDFKGLLGRKTGHAFPRPRRSVNTAGSDFVETPTVSPLERLQRTTPTEHAP
jgi:hypothetical protein